VLCAGSIGVICYCWESAGEKIPKQPEAGTVLCCLLSLVKNVQDKHVETEAQDTVAHFEFPCQKEFLLLGDLSAAQSCQKEMGFFTRCGWPWMIKECHLGHFWF